MKPFRFIVGIDLGTSSCALSYVDRYAHEAIPKTLPITQWHTHGLIESETLPSYCYIPKNKDADTYKIPFSSLPPPYVVGALARELLMTQADLVVHSAKSWLCHGGVDREAKILPWHSDTLIGEKRLSPVFVSSLYLRHLKDVWNARMAEGREDFLLHKQKIILTVPASFDEVASYLTLEAAKLAGLGDDVTLCEEPQAAFYNALAGCSDKLESDKTILVVDIGGGTSDFCLFKTGEAQLKDRVSIERIAVSEHILLGGDNIDLALAHLAESKLLEQGVEKWSGEKWAKLIAECRLLKEKTLRESHDEQQYHLTLQMNSGSKLFGQTQTLTFTHKEILDTVVEGFFPPCEREDKVKRNPLALKEWGLPYAEDSAVSRHIAEFLKGRQVDYVLYTGGTLIPKVLQERLTELITKWQETAPQVLQNDSLELAVSRGASLFGYRQVHKDKQVSAGYPRSLYIKVLHAEKQKARFLCIVPKGFQNQDTLRLSPQGLHALLGQAARFELFSSLSRPEDLAGDWIDGEDVNLKPVSFLQTILGQADKRQRVSVPISLEIHLANSGLLELFILRVEGDLHRLHFALNAQEHGPVLGGGVVLSAPKVHAVECIQRFYGKEKSISKLNPMSLFEDLEKTLGASRKDWDVGVLRSLWPALKEGMNRRNRSEQHELIWLSLAGYLLRPGYGDPLDSLRIREVQGLFSQGPVYPLHAKIKNQWWIFWRRISGGLDRKMQDTIFSKVYPQIKQDQASPEMILLLGSLERVEMQKRVALAQRLSSEIVSSPLHREQKLWALTRIANRQPLYGGAECVVRPHFIIPCLERLSRLDLKKVQGLSNFFANACRRIDDRELDIPESLRSKIMQHLESQGFAAQAQMLREYSPLDSQTVSTLMGEALPIGLVYG
jgi:molecular chaperone DnaK (HSP70)